MYYQVYSQVNIHLYFLAGERQQEFLPNDNWDADKDDAHKHMPFVIKFLVVVIPPEIVLSAIEFGMEENRFLNVLTLWSATPWPTLS